MMTREEAITILQDKYDYCKSFYDLAAHPEEDYPEMAKYLQALQIALTALRPVSREQVEKVPRCEHCKDGKSFDGQVVIMGNKGMFPLNFCPRCGSPLTDEAEEMVMRRLGALHEKT